MILISEVGRGEVEWPGYCPSNGMQEDNMCSILGGQGQTSLAEVGNRYLK